MKGIDDCTENMSGITIGYQNYEKCECRDQCIKKGPESETGNFQSLTKDWDFYNLQQ